MISMLELFCIFCFYLFPSYCIFIIAKKFGAQDKTRAWIPIISILLLCEITERPNYYVLLMFIPFVNLFVWGALWMDIAGGLGHDRTLGILAAIPLIHLIGMGYIAFAAQPPGWQKP